MTFARWVLKLAGVYGLIVVAPQYLLEGMINQDYPPEITHPEFYYGFTGVALAWQVAFLIMSTDPLRYRWLLIPGALEKLSFGGAVFALLATGRVSGPIVVFATIDLLWAGLFLAAFWQLRPTFVAKV